MGESPLQRPDTERVSAHGKPPQGQPSIKTLDILHHSTGDETTRRDAVAIEYTSAATSLAAGMQVDVTSYFDGVERRLQGFRVVPYDIPKGCVASYYSETNALIPIDAVGDKSNTTAYKSVVVSLAPSD